MRLFRRPDSQKDDPFADALAQIVAADSLDTWSAALIRTTRELVGSDGVTLVRRTGETVTYVGEDAISPLWTGQSFPIRLCVSGQAILARAPIVIPDIHVDRRVPLNAYLATFARSMILVPIGPGDPHWALGAYWQAAQPIAPIAIARMAAIADTACQALERLEPETGNDRQVA